MPPTLRVISDQEKAASPGKFRACTIIDSEIYQVGEDADTPIEAVQICLASTRNPRNDLFVIYDDQGRAVKLR